VHGIKAPISPAIVKVVNISLVRKSIIAEKVIFSQVKNHCTKFVEYKFFDSFSANQNFKK